MKKFYILDVISVAYNRSLNLDGVEGMRDLVNYLTGTNVSGSDLEKVCKDSMSYLLSKYKVLSNPEMAYAVGKLHSSVDNTDLSDADMSKQVKQWLNSYVVPITGEFIELEPIRNYSLKG